MTHKRQMPTRADHIFLADIAVRTALEYLVDDAPDLAAVKAYLAEALVHLTIARGAAP